MAVSFNIDGQAYSFPDWATESTQDQIKDILSAMAKQNGVSDATLKKLLKSTDDMVDANKDENKKDEKRADEQKKRDEKALKASNELGQNMKEFSNDLSDFADNLEAPTGFFGKVRENLESDGEQLGAAMGRAAEITLGATAAAVGTLSVAGTYIFSQLKGAGETINGLTRTGVGFNDTFADVGLTTTQAIGNLGALGVGFQGAAELIKNSSAVVATQGFGRFNNSMKFAADVSEDLGMSFEDSMETFGDALARRQKIVNLGNVDQNRVNQTIRTTVKSQMAYATALGASTEELQAFVDSLVRDNGLLTASLLGMSDTMRNDVIAGVEVFASGMAAMGGKAGQDIASAFLEAGSAGAIGLSDAATGIVTALPQMRGPMEDFASALQSGTLSQDDANAMVQNMTKELGNLSDGEKQRIQLLARTGDESAKMMANAIAQFEQSESKLDKINEALGTGFNMDAVQQGTNNFNKIMAQVSGGAQNAFYSLFANPEILGVIEDAMGEIMGAFGFGVDSMSGLAQDGGKELADKFVPMLKKAVTFVTDILKQFAEYVSPFFKEDGGGLGALFSDMWDRVTDAAMGMLIKGVAGFAVALFGFSVAKQFGKSILMPQLTKFMGGIFDKASGAMGSVAAKGAQGVMGSAGAIGDKLKSSAGAVTEKLSGTKVGQMASSKLGNVMDKGKGMTDKLSGSMTGGGKSGGFLAKIADAVKEFGDTKVVKGAASLTLLGAALALTAVGLKTFNEVDPMSLVKGGAALLGLVGIARLVGEASTDMLKGAAGIAILGASLIPAAYGLKMFNEVDWGSLAKGGTALLGLVGVAKLIGNMTGALLKGALGIAGLGASLLPLAFSLSLMKDVGAGTIGVIAASLVTLGLAGVAVGMTLPLMLAGSVGIAALGASLLPLAISLNLMKGVGMDTIGVLAGSLVTLGAAAAAMGIGLPFILAGSAAIAALGVALIPFAAGAQLAGIGAQSLASGLKDLANIPVGGIALNLLGLGTAMTLMLPLIPGLVLTGAALGALGVALIPFGVGAQLAGLGTESLAAGMSKLNNVDLPTIAKGLLALGGAMTLMIPLIPGLLLTGTALGVAGVALLPFALGATLAAGPTTDLAYALSMLNMVDPGQLVSLSGGILSLSGALSVMGLAIPLVMLAGMAAGPIKALAVALMPLSMVDMYNLLLAGDALKSLGSGMSALSGGSLMSSVKDGIGSLFGADSPIDKLKEFVKNLSDIDVHPLLDAAYGLESLVTSGERLPEFANTIAIVGEGMAPFVGKMGYLASSIKRLGDDPFAPFGTLDTHAEGMTRFSTSAEQLTTALDAIDGDYVSDQFYAIGDGIQYMVEQMDELNMADMLKLGAMKLFGPSKEERQDAKQQSAVKSTAFDKLHGDFGSNGLYDLMDKITAKSGANAMASGEDPLSQIISRQTELSAAGVNVDTTALLSGDTGKTTAAMQEVTRQLQAQIDMYKMQSNTGVDQTSVPIMGRAAEPETPDTPQQTPATEASATAVANMTPPSAGGPTQLELLAELVKLQSENNRLAKKTKGSIESIEV